MRVLALLAAVLVILAGSVALFAPEGLLNAFRPAFTPMGIYLIAAVRVGIGVLLMRVAPQSRAPDGLRLLGFFIIVAGVLTPLIGVERSLAIIDWEVTRGQAIVRAGGVVALTAGGFIAWAVSRRQAIA